MGPLLLSRPATVPRQAQRSDTLCNQQVRCSSHPTSSNLPFRHTSELGGIPEWPKGADCKSVVSDFGGSNSPSPTKKSDILWIPDFFAPFCCIQTGYNLSSRNLIWDIGRVGLVVSRNSVNDGNHLPAGMAHGRHVGLPFIPFFLEIKLQRRIVEHRR